MPRCKNFGGAGTLALRLVRAVNVLIWGVVPLEFRGEDAVKVFGTVFEAEPVEEVLVAEDRGAVNVLVGPLLLRVR